ncbi:SCO6880 family protein (plasmid) [Saccharopolyspora sp. ID03-671]|uniref:SCO6880 family protein n=1 Tax=Saccharopolyspora sp. ID03-671 TaxID=3073066 RepID=UPI0030F45EE8
MSTDTRSAAVASEPRYGNWRKPRSFGLLGLSFGPTIGALAWLLTSFVVMMISLPLGWAMLALGALALAPLALRVRGRTLYSLLLARSAFNRGRRHRQHLHLAGPLGVIPGATHRLPGLLAATNLHTAQDSYGREFGLLEHTGTGQFSAVLRVDPEGSGLVDQDRIDQWVAGWGDWLARLGQVPGLEGVQVTVETAGDSGQRLAAEVDRITTPTSPQLAREVLTETAASYPSAAASVNTWVAITWRAAVTPGAKARSLADMAAEIGARLPALGQDLALTGAGSARPMTVRQLTELAFVAYNPDLADDLDRARGEHDITWTSAGPAGLAVEKRDRYLHGGGISVVDAMEEAPRGAVLSSVLGDLLAPHPDFTRKRVMLHYRPHDPGTSARIVERDLRNARSNATQRRNTHARDDADVRAAQQQTDEEASGAGLVSFGLIATATVLDPEQMRVAEATLHNNAAASRLVLRRAYGAQTATFAVGLGLGLQPDAVATLGGLTEGE